MADAGFKEFPIDLTKYEVPKLDPFTEKTLPAATKEQILANVQLCRDAIVSFIASNKHTSGTVSYAPPVCPPYPDAAPHAVNETMASRQSCTFARICSFVAAGSVFSVKGSSFGTSYFSRSIGNSWKPASAIASIAFVGVKTALPPVPIVATRPA